MLIKASLLVVGIRIQYSSSCKMHNSVTSVLKNHTCIGYLRQTKPMTMNTLAKISFLFFFGLNCILGQAQENLTITIKVEKADNNDGKMYIALYDSEAGFLKQPFKSVKSNIVNNTCTVTFDTIAKGTYAVSIFHDENNNGKLDTNFLGIPTEDYGCSNDAKGFMGPPRWEDAKFNVNEDKIFMITL